MFAKELRQEYKRLVSLKTSMLKRRMVLEDAWRDFSTKLKIAESDNTITDIELEQLYAKNDKFAYVVGIARDRETSIGKLLGEMATMIDTYNEYERRCGRA